MELKPIIKELKKFKKFKKETEKKKIWVLDYTLQGYKKKIYNQEDEYIWPDPMDLNSVLIRSFSALSIGFIGSFLVFIFFFFFPEFFQIFSDYSGNMDFYKLIFLIFFAFFITFPFNLSINYLQISFNPNKYSLGFYFHMMQILYISLCFYLIFIVVAFFWGIFISTNISQIAFLIYLIFSFGFNTLFLDLLSGVKYILSGIYWFLVWMFIFSVLFILGYTILGDLFSYFIMPILLFSFHFGSSINEYFHYIFFKIYGVDVYRLNVIE